MLCVLLAVNLLSCNHLLYSHLHVLRSYRFLDTSFRSPMLDSVSVLKYVTYKYGCTLYASSWIRSVKCTLFLRFACLYFNLIYRPKWLSCWHLFNLKYFTNLCNNHRVTDWKAWYAVKLLCLLLRPS